MPMTLAQLLALLPDNTTGAIGADDMRTVTTELYTQGVVAPPVTSVDGEVGAVDLTDNYLKLLTVVNTPKTATTYTAAPGEYLTFDTTSNAITVTLPVTPPNGTLVGGHIVTLGAGNFVGFNCGAGAVFNKAGGPTIGTGALQYANQSIVYEYWSGIWQTVVTGVGLSALDSRYVQSSTALTAGAGTDIQLDAPVGNVQNISVLTASHNLWTPLFVRATADQACALSNVTVIDDDTLQFAYAASSTYDFQIRATYTGGAGASVSGLRTQVSVTGAPTLNYVGLGPHSTWAGTGAVVGGGGYDITAASGDQRWGLPTAFAPYTIVFFGTLVSTTAGTFKLRFAQGAADATNVLTRKAGSSLTARKVA